MKEKRDKGQGGRNAEKRRLHGMKRKLIKEKKKNRLERNTVRKAENKEVQKRITSRLLRSLSKTARADHRGHGQKGQVRRRMTRPLISNLREHTNSSYRITQTR